MSDKFGRSIHPTNPQVAVQVKFTVMASVWLPEDEVDDGEGEVTSEARGRAWDAVIGALPQDCEVFIDGEDKQPARVYIEPDEDETTAEMWAE